MSTNPDHRTALLPIQVPFAARRTANFDRVEGFLLDCMLLVPGAIPRSWFSSHPAGK
jgi:hypothetical protein